MFAGAGRSGHTHCETGTHTLRVRVVVVRNLPGAGLRSYTAVVIVVILCQDDKICLKNVPICCNTRLICGPLLTLYKLIFPLEKCCPPHFTIITTTATSFEDN